MAAAEGTLKLLFRSKTPLCSWMNIFRKRRIPEGNKLCWHRKHDGIHPQTLRSVVLHIKKKQQRGNFSSPLFHFPSWKGSSSACRGCNESDRFHSQSTDTPRVWCFPQTSASTTFYNPNTCGMICTFTGLRWGGGGKSPVLQGPLGQNALPTQANLFQMSER